MLQWGHVQVNVETMIALNILHHPLGASMGPRSGERGNQFQLVCLQWMSAQASMGPRSGERGNISAQHSAVKFFRFASMGQRSGERGD